MQVTMHICVLKYSRFTGIIEIGLCIPWLCFACIIRMFTKVNNVYDLYTSIIHYDLFDGKITPKDVDEF